MTDYHEENINTNRLRLSVPNPTTRRKKKDEKANRNKQTNVRIDQSSQHLHQIQEKLNEEKKLVSVAYIIIIPNDDGFDDDNDSNEEGNNSGLTRKRRQYRAMKALAKSIEVAHIESKYDYHLYALSLGSLALSSWTMREYSKLGIETIVVNETDLNGNNSIVDMATEPSKTVVGNRRLDVVELNENNSEEEGRIGLLGILSQHDIIVQLSLNSIMFHSMDDVFDAIMRVGQNSDIAGIVESHSDVDGGRKEERVIERLELTNSAIVNDSDLYIFKSTSQREHTSFLNRLACQLSKKQRMTTDADQDPLMSVADCSTWIANEDVRLLLDRCIYDAGSNGRNCLHALTLDDIRLARFSGKLVKPHSNNTNVDQEEDKESSCRTPWEYRSEVKCLNDHVGHVNEKICYYICKKWFQLVDIS
jgi:hypothetical protein